MSDRINEFMKETKEQKEENFRVSANNLQSNGYSNIFALILTGSIVSLLIGIATLISKVM